MNNLALEVLEFKLERKFAEIDKITKERLESADEEVEEVTKKVRQEPAEA